MKYAGVKEWLSSEIKRLEELKLIEFNNRNEGAHRFYNGQWQALLIVQKKLQDDESKPSTPQRAEELWEKYSQHPMTIASKLVITELDFYEAMESYRNQPKQPMEEETFTDIISPLQSKIEELKGEVEELADYRKLVGTQQEEIEMLKHENEVLHKEDDAIFRLNDTISEKNFKISSLESENEDLKTAWALSQSENVKLREELNELKK